MAYLSFNPHTNFIRQVCLFTEVHKTKMICSCLYTSKDAIWALMCFFSTISRSISRTLQLTVVVTIQFEINITVVDRVQG